MGQEEIISFLRSKRLEGDESYFTIPEILKGCNGGSPHYSAVRKSVYGLLRAEIVESKNIGDVFEWVRAFRLREKYVTEK